MMTIEPLDVYSKVAVIEKILFPCLVIYASERIGFYILADITGEIIDVRTAVYRECTVPFYHPVARCVTGLE
jgi:hypothetical protein